MYSLTILTLEKQVMVNNISSAIFPGVDGYFEVLTSHAPILALIKAGEIKITVNGGTQHLYKISTGLLEISQNKATFFTDFVS